jgi:hypothetical protein
MHGAIAESTQRSLNIILFAEACLENARKNKIAM